MGTCKDCLHYGVCGGFTPTDLDRDVWHYCTQGRQDEIPDIENRCSDFKNKSRFIELPCSVGDIVYHVTTYRGVVEAKVRVMFINENGAEYIRTTAYDAPFGAVGKTLFIGANAKEEAENASKEIKE